MGTTDAAVLARQFGGKIPEPADLVTLANYEMFIKLMMDGVQTKAFSAKSLPPS